MKIKETQKAIFASLITCLFLIGCGGGASDAPDLVGATGVVTYKDEPVAGANVTFQVEGNPISTGSTDAEGKFVMSTGGRPGVPPGEAVVTITKKSSDEKDMSAMKPEDMEKMATQNQGKMQEAKNEIPAKYSDPKEGGLVATIGPDASKNVFEYRLLD